MSILVIGGTGHVGSKVVESLADRGATARILTTDPAKAKLPAGMTAMKGDLLDPASLRAALKGIDTLFLLVAVSPAELTQALLAIDLAHEAGVGHIIYFSQLRLNWPDCPHAVAKRQAEELVRHHAMNATILRPAYFMQNDMALKTSIAAGTYPIPIGQVGADMVDIRDIAEISAIAMTDPGTIGTQPVVELVGPDTITGAHAAEIWSAVSGRDVAYGGNDIGRSFEEAQAMPAWQAHDLVAMFRGCQREGMIGEPGAAERLETILGRELHSYRDFAGQAYAQWQKS